MSSKSKCKSKEQEHGAGNKSRSSRQEWWSRSKCTRNEQNKIKSSKQEQGAGARNSTSKEQRTGREHDQEQEGASRCMSKDHEQ